MTEQNKPTGSPEKKTRKPRTTKKPTPPTPVAEVTEEQKLNQQLDELYKKYGQFYPPRRTV